MRVASVKWTASNTIRKQLVCTNEVKCERSDSANFKSPQCRKVHESVKDIGYKYALFHT